MLLEYVFRATNRLGLVHVYALVPYRLRVLPHTLETPELALYTGRKCAGADCGGEYGDHAAGVWVRGRDACAELSAQERGVGAHILEYGFDGAMVAGAVLLWGCVCGPA